MYRWFLIINYVKFKLNIHIRFQVCNEGATVVEGRRAAGRGSRAPLRPPTPNDPRDAHGKRPVHFARGKFK